MKVLLLNDTRDHDNWGSRACAEGLLAILERELPGAEISSIPSAWTTRRYRVASPRFGGRIYPGTSRWRQVYRRFSRDFHFLPAVADDFEPAAVAWLSGRAGPDARGFLEAVSKVDAVLFNAEGSTYRANDSAIKCLFALWLAKTRLGVPAVFLNGTVHLTGVDPVLPAIARKTFRAIDRVAVREPRSLANLRSYAPEVRGELVPDSVFQFEPAVAERASAGYRSWRERLGGRPYFCLSLSMLLSAQPGYLAFGARGSALAELVRSLLEVVPQGVLMARDGMDQRIVRAVAAETGCHVFGPEHGYPDLAALLGGAAFAVSGRYHHLIFATLTGCPALALRTTSHKVDGLCELLGGELGRPFDATDLFSEAPAIVARARALAEDRPARSAALLERAAELRARTSRLGELVQEALSGRRRERP
ncbi:MAG TPA: polysaccharide pyruvyl transferase family protein [Thermoanaerobaculia bacterium]|nr:polysaccharide pyruvyl transferase family protein [Thermoanaerobaculia bacterium]